MFVWRMSFISAGVGEVFFGDAYLINRYFLFCIMDSTIYLIVCKTGKQAPLEKVQMNIQTFLVNIKLTLRNLPRGATRLGLVWYLS